MICERCGGQMGVEKDLWGKYLFCLQCGWVKELNISERLELVPESKLDNFYHRTQKEGIQGDVVC
jgi:hypothetical protein